MTTDLADFVLDFCRAAGGVVEPPAYGVHEILLPDGAAAELGVEPFLRVAFDEAAAGAEAMLLAYGHPLVERLTDLARAQPACARFYLNDVRLDKSGLAALARAALAFPNASLNEAPSAVEARALFRYVRFNFTAALISDEKREHLVSVLLDAQAGAAVPDFTPEEAVRLAETPQWDHLPAAPAGWTTAPDPLAGEPFRFLLERAGQAAVEALAGPLAALQARAARHLELDRARLDDYYAGLERDLERRLQRAEDEAKRASVESKLAATRADRAAKLADAEAKYRARVELDLVNLAVIAQPKLRLTMRVENRQAAVTRDVVWDPLRHAIEPLPCDVCRRPSNRLYLCANNHLACDRCLAPQCVDCKRVYCQACAQDVTTCVVCDRPVCRKSLARCPVCGRGTCQTHAGLCHAAAGEPQRVVVVAVGQPAPGLEKLAPTPPAPAAPAAVPRPRRAPKPEAGGSRPPDWLAALPPAEAAALAPQLDRFTRIARGWLYYEGALEADDLVKLTKTAARPADWYTPERARALLAADPVLRSVRGIIAHPDAAHPLVVVREKAERRLPPRRFSAEQLLAVAEGPPPLTAREAQLARALNSVAAGQLDLRDLQRRMRNTSRPTDVIAYVFDQVRLRHERELDDLGHLLSVLWNETPRYELRGRAPNDLHASGRFW